jgi:hypothetical protein
MPSEDAELKSLFAGVEDEQLLYALYDKVTRNRARSSLENSFCLVWESSEMINGDGFEMLIEQIPSLEEYSQAYTDVGMPQVSEVFARVIALIPTEMRQRSEGNGEYIETKLFQYIHEHFEVLNQLMLEFFDASKEEIAILGQFIRDHPEEFAKYSRQ